MDRLLLVLLFGKICIIIKGGFIIRLLASLWEGMLWELLGGAMMMKIMEVCIGFVKINGRRIGEKKDILKLKQEWSALINGLLVVNLMNFHFDNYW